MMKKELPETKICKHCSTEIPYAAKVCPQCRKRVKGGGCTKILLIILAVLIALIIGIVAIGSETDDATSTLPTQSSSGNESHVDTNNESDDDSGQVSLDQTVFHVGETLEEDNMYIVYMSSGEYIEENEYLQPEDGYKYIFLEFAFENISSLFDSYVSYFDFECYADGYAAEHYYGGTEGLSATLSPGRSTTGFIYFTIPADSTEVEIEYTSSYYTDDKITFVYEGDMDSGYEVALNTTASSNAILPGTTVEENDVVITYLSVSEYTSDNYFVQPKEGYRYITGEFEFENLGDYDIYASTGSFCCYADGLSCEQSYLRDDCLSATISSGRKAKGTVTFEVPVDATIVEMELELDFWSSDKLVFNANID